MSTITIEYPCSRSNDKATKEQDKEFLRTVCAFANSKGGRIVLLAKENKRYSDKDVDDITRKFEQKTSDAFGLLTAVKMMSREKVSGGEEPSELIFNVKAWRTSRQPCTVNYNLYFATESQVKQIDSSETVESMVENIIGKKRKRKDWKEDFAFGSHYGRFAFGEAVPLRESKDTQFKCLKDEKSKNSDMVTRMQKNKLTSYISAFANGDGGHIYYGINDQKVVVGQVVENREEITREVEKIIRKMLWPKDCGEVERGKHWEIFFEPVSGVDDKFVIVIAVAPSPQPVFAEKPESYHVVDGQVKMLNYTEWEKRLRRHRILDRSPMMPIVDIAQHVARCRWSSEKAELIHYEVSYELSQLRNQGDETFLTRITELRTELQQTVERRELQQTVDYTENMEIILQQEESAYDFRNGVFQKANTLLVKNECYTGKCRDVKIYEVSRLYRLCVVKRSLGELEDSDKLFTDAMQLAQLTPPMIIEAWLLVSKAKKLEIDIATQYDPREPQSCNSLIEQCKGEYYKALGKADVAQDLEFGIVDLKQRVHIFLARIFLGSFYGQEKITRTVGCKEEDLKEAQKMLEIVVRWRNLQGHTMVLFCKCEYHLMLCEQEIRNWERFKKPEFFKKACENSAKALKIAKKNNFKSICCYAKDQHAYLGIELKL